MTKNNAASLLTSVDELFTTEQEREQAKREAVQELPLAEIADFPNQPFKVRMDESMADLAESVRQYGVLVPALVRPMPEGGYQMVAGHRRKMASELAGKQTLACLVRELTDDEATIIMVDSNLQREQVLPSEKAFAYKMKLDAMKRQGARTDLTSSPVATRLNTAAKLAEKNGESRDQIYRFIRLTNLIPELLDMVDEGRIAMRPAVELSYLAADEQQILCETMQSEACTPSHVQAIKLRKFADEGILTADVVLSIMQEEKPNQKEQFKIPRERINKYFAPGTSRQKIEETIIKALELYRRRQRDRDAR